jgi:hypothetical protein
MPSKDELQETFRRNRPFVEQIAAAVLVASVAVVLGLRARDRFIAIRLQQGRVSAEITAISRFRQAFRSAPNGRDSLRVAAASDSVVLGVPRRLRLSLAQTVALAAEEAGLRDVRIRFGGTDTAYVPPRSASGPSPVVVADYTVSLECSGGFADVLTFVSKLPVTVSLSRLRAAREPGNARGHFFLTFAVYQSANDNQSG